MIKIAVLTLPHWTVNIVFGGVTSISKSCVSKCFHQLRGCLGVYSAMGKELVNIMDNIAVIISVESQENINEEDEIL